MAIPIPVNSPFPLFGHCMVWRYALGRNGYGTLMVEGNNTTVHRAAYIQSKGPIPEGLQINHLCNRPYCIQPSHLYAGTHQDNRDDSQVFNDPKLFMYPGIALMPVEIPDSNFLLRRLRETQRQEPVEPWDPIQQPRMRPLEEFSCPGHDFAITMQFSKSRICRICEKTELQEEEADGFGAIAAIAEMCPATQTVTPILEKTAQSEFLKESHRDIRLRTHRRSRFGISMGSHDLRDCPCEYCVESRKAFRETLNPLLTPEETSVLDACDRLYPLIRSALEEASIRVMEAWAEPARLNGDQAQTLREHHEECAGWRSARKSRELEGEIAYLVHAAATRRGLDDLMQDPVLKRAQFRFNFLRIMEDDKEPAEKILLPIVTETTGKITSAIGEELPELATPDEGEPNIIRAARNILTLNLMKEILEHLRFELTGRNSFASQSPHPHAWCLRIIFGTGTVQRFPNEFEEGMGYRPDRE